VPSWGRPPGAKGSKRRRAWEREQAEWEHRVRVEEIDTDDTDIQGVGFNSGAKRFSSDPLQFTGLDLASNFRSRRNYVPSELGESSDGSEDSDEDDHDEMQAALRDKEEALVQSALARIRRAQEKGKREVKLNQEELDALERRRKRMQAAATAKARKGSASSGGSGSERKRRTITVPIAPAEPNLQPTGRMRSKSKSHRSEEYSPHPPGATNPPGMLVAGPDGLTFAPVGYYQPQPGGRPRSATYQQQAARGGPPSAHRNFSEGMRPTSSSSASRRPLPDEVEWMPTNSRRSSGSSQHLIDPFEYQISPDHPPPIPHQYMQSQLQYQNQSIRDTQNERGASRRVASGPPDVAYSTIRRSPPGMGYQAQAARIPASNSDPLLRLSRSARSDDYRDELAPSSSEDDDEDDDLGNGVQVFVEEPSPDREKEKSVSRKPAGGRKRGKR